MTPGPWWSRLVRWPFYLMFTLVVYLSLRPGPEAASVPFFPHPLGLWFDRHDFLRNLFGYGCLALAGFAGASFASADALSFRWGSHGEVRVTAGKWLAALLSLVVLLETAQIMLPRRTAHWRDVAAGWAGMVVAWAIYCVFRGIRPIRFKPSTHATATGRPLDGISL